jgi:RHS repeat-associated protein
MATRSSRRGCGGRRRVWRGVVTPAVRWYAVVLLGVAFSLVATPTALADQVRSGFVDPVLGDPVPVSASGIPQVDTQVVEHAHVWSPGEVGWPEPGVTVVEVTPDSAPAGDGLLVAAAGGGPEFGVAGAADPASPGSVRVEVLDRNAAAAAGISGLLLTVDAVNGAGEVDLAVDYAEFAGAYGGAWASRLRLVKLPRCVLTSPQRAVCRLSSELETVNDTAQARVAARVSVGSRSLIDGPKAVSGGEVMLDPLSTVSGSDGGTVLALTAGDASEAGDWSATDLQSAGSWTHGGSSGGFAYSYDMRVPPVAGPSPQLGLGYSSQSHDGLTSGSNNQASWVGDGWGLPLGFIERSYKACADDMDGGNNSVPTGDLCWDGDSPSITMSLNGVNTSLVKDDTTGTWHAASDGNWRIELLGSPASSSSATTERWVVTTTDGTRWFFAGEASSSSSRWTVPVFGNHSGEPCRSSQFKDSSCRQAYRWMLDKAIDVHGNMTRYFYANETGHYGAAGDATMRRAYHRAGHLERIDYGLRESHPTGQPAAQVKFSVGDRCLDSCWSGAEPRADNWPDTPWDRTCDTAPCTEQTSPAFFSAKRLVEVTTQVHDGSEFPPVDSWQLEHEFLDYGDESQVVMWLKSIQHTGHVGGTETLPAMSFVGWPKPNRVNHNGIPGIWRWRMQSITSETGGITTINYSSPDCGAGDLPASPHTNIRLCYPVWWTPEFHSEPTMDWFHKYVVDSVVAQDTTGAGGDVWTYYDYATSGGGTSVLWGWDDSEFTDDDHRTYSQWRGYPQVTTKIGDPAEGPQQVSHVRYYRGMHGQPLPTGGTRNVSVTDSEGNQVTDHRALAGATFETVSFLGGSIDAATTYRYWRQRTASRSHDGGTLEAWMSAMQRQESRQRLTGSTWQRTRADTTFDNHGRAVEVHDRGDLNVTSDSRCTRAEYANNISKWILTAVARTETVAAACSATPNRPDDVISDVRTFFDGSSTHGASPSKGLPTRTEVLDDWDGGPVYVTTGQTSYDNLGRATSTTDALGHTTTTAFTPSGAGPVTTTTWTNPLGHQSVTDLDPARGEPTSIVDANGRRTDLTYDPLGRLTAVWLPGQDKDKDKPANFVFTYRVNNDKPSVTTTQRITANGGYATSTILLDSLQRGIQTQNDTPQGGRLVTETEYNTRGLVEYSSGPNWDETSTPNGTFVRVPQGADHARVWYTYDSLGRATKEELWSKNVKLWETTTAYGGSAAGFLVRTTPPAGGVPTGVLTNARGELIHKRDYHGSTASGSYDAMTYVHNHRGQLATVTDPAGNQWSFDYDLRGQRVANHDPDSGTTTAVYDHAGRLVSTTDARGETLSTAYDPLGRPAQRWQGQPDTGTLIADWSYDTRLDGVGLPATARVYVDGHTILTQYGGYDAAGRATRVQSTIPKIPGLEDLAGKYMVTTLYNIDGTVASVALPPVGGLSGEGIVYTYNDTGQPDRMKGDLFHTGHTQTYVDSTSYTAWGELAQRTLGASFENQVYHTYAYADGTRRLKDFRLSRDAVGATNVAHLKYERDPAGNILSIADAVEDSPGVPERQCFSYDHLRRLVEAWAQAGLDPCADQPSTDVMGGPAPYWSSYTFDVTGNRTSETRHHADGGATTSTYTYPGHSSPQPHTLTSVTTGAQTDTYTYDPAGNMTSRTVAGNTETIDWNASGKPQTITDNIGDTTRMIYNPDGDRIARIDPNGDAHLFIAGHEITYNSATGATTAVRSYRHNGQVVATRSSTHGLQWVAGDHHNTAAWAIDAQTMVTTYRRQDPYGNPRGDQQAWPAGQEGFVRGINDPTRLVHIGARSYDPTTGRFISSDPIDSFADSQQINGYTYANGSPVTFSDHTGLLVCTPDGIGYCPGYDVGLQPNIAVPCGILCKFVTSSPAPEEPQWISKFTPPSLPFSTLQENYEAQLRQKAEEKEKQALEAHEQAWREYESELWKFEQAVATCDFYVKRQARRLPSNCSPESRFIDGDCKSASWSVGRNWVEGVECTYTGFRPPTPPAGPVPDWFLQTHLGATGNWSLSICVIICLELVADSSGVGFNIGGVGIGGWSTGPGVTSVPQSEQGVTLQGCLAWYGGVCLQGGPKNDGGTFGGASAVTGTGGFVGGMWQVFHVPW